MKVKPTDLRFSSLLITLLFALLVRVSLLHATNVPLPAAPIMPFDSTEDEHVEEQILQIVPMRNVDASHHETKQEQHDENSLSEAYAIKSSSSLTITTSLYLPLILKNSSVTSIITATTTPTTSSTVTSTPITEIGDVNCNGDLDTIDGMFILRYSVSLINGVNTCPPPDNTLYEPQCDVNSDAECNVLDALIVLKCDVNLWDDHLCPSPPPSALRSASRSKQTLSEGVSATVAIGSYEMLPMSALTVPVTASVPSDISFGAGEIRVTYDANALAVENCQVNSAFIGFCNTNLAGVIEFNAISLSGAMGAFTLAEITFQAIDQASNSTILDVDVEAFGDTAANPISVSDVDGEITIISTATPTSTPTPTITPTPTNTPELPTDVTIMVDPETTTVDSGQTFNVSVVVNAGAQEVDGASAYLNFDKDVLEVVSMTGGSFFQFELQNSFDNDAGTIDFAAGSFSNLPSGNITLVDIEFEAIAPTAGSELAFNFSAPRQTDVTSAGASVLAGHSNGEVIIQLGPTSVTIGDINADGTPRERDALPLLAIGLMMLAGAWIARRQCLAPAVSLDDLPVFYDIDPPPLSPPLYRLYIPFIR